MAEAKARSAVCVVVVVALMAVLAQPAAATNFVVTIKSIDSPGGQRFSKEFSDAAKVMKSATTFIQRSFSLSPLKDIPTVTLTVDSFDGVAQTGGAGIELSSDYVAQQSSNTVAFHKEIAGVLYHEMTHVWQNNNGNYGTDQFFRGTIEGIADWIRLTSGFASAGWPKRARGGNWYDGYTTTAYFLDWIQKTHGSQFVNKLNQKMAQPWTNNFFKQITGKTVNQLWTSYQNSI